eukprot:1633072-Amphidinium_carterae.1
MRSSEMRTYVESLRFRCSFETQRAGRVTAKRGRKGHTSRSFPCVCLEVGSTSNHSEVLSMLSNQQTYYRKRFEWSMQVRSRSPPSRSDGHISRIDPGEDYCVHPNFYTQFSFNESLHECGPSKMLARLAGSRVATTYLSQPRVIEESVAQPPVSARDYHRSLSERDSRVSSSAV